MKKFKEFILAILILAAVGSLIYFMYQRGSNKTNRELAKRMMEISPRGGPPETIEGLRQAIALYEDQIERNIREGAQTGVYWKILGTRLADTRGQGQHAAALEAFEKAIYYNAEDASLYYLTGISAAMVAKSKVGFSVSSVREQEHYFRLAENSHLRALEIEPTYTRPMYALGVLYAFELDRGEDAIVQLERYLQILPSDINAMFVLARAYYMTRNFRRSAEIYDRIIDRSRNQEEKQNAMINKDEALRMMYE